MYKSSDNFIGRTVGKTFDVIEVTNIKNKKNYFLYRCRCRECSTEVLMDARKINRDTAKCPGCFVKQSERIKQEMDKKKGGNIEESIYHKLYGEDAQMPELFKDRLNNYFYELTTTAQQILRLRYENKLTTPQIGDLMEYGSRQNVSSIELKSLKKIQTLYEQDKELEVSEKDK